LHSRSIQIEKINPAEFFGPNNSNLKHLKSFFPTLKISARGNVLSVNGDEETMDEFERKLNLLIQHFNQFNTLTENNIDNLMLEEGKNMLSVDDGSETLVHGNGGVKIKARTVNQKKLVQAVNEYDMVFAVGRQELEKHIQLWLWPFVH
jgi:phosphate starvation-inducible PhoH-like protein